MTSSDRDDPILDAFLDELLGGHAPPDLTARIMQAWQAGSEGQPTPVQPPSPQASSPESGLPAPPIQSEPNGQPPVQPARVHRFSRRRPRSTFWPAVAVVLAVVAVGVTIGIAARQFAGGNPAPERLVDSTAPRRLPGKNVPSRALPGEDAPGVPRRENLAQAPTRKPSAASSNALPQEDEAAFAEQQQPADLSPAPPEQPGYAVGPDPLPDEEVLARADELLRQSWTENNVQPAAPATDAEWCRRAHVALLGRIPTVEELQQFVQSRSPSKKRELVARLQSADGYADEFARHWAGFWANVLIGRTGGTQPDGLAHREGLLRYLRQSLQYDKRYDQMVFELVSATGSSRPGAADFNGASNFLLASMDEKSTLATSRIARVFHGRQIRCVQCHDHPSNEDWTQNQFWEMNAFLRQMHAERDRATGNVRLVNRDFAGEGKGDAKEAEVYYEQLNGYTRAAYPAFPGAPPVSPSGLLADVDRRQELGKILIASRQLSRAAVNRVWSHFFGYGFTRPVDDMGSHNPASHPELLDHLAGQFEAGGYRLKRLIQWIALSDAFSLSSKVGQGNPADVPEDGGVALFSRYYTRQLPPEAVYDSLVVLAQAQNSGAFAQQDHARVDWLGQFARNMGTDEGEEQSTFNGDIRQSMIMMTDPLMRRAISQQEGSLLHRVVNSKLSAEEKVEHLFLAAVARKPSSREMSLARRMLSDRHVDQATALQNIWWALLNSNEFILDH